MNSRILEYLEFISVKKVALYYRLINSYSFTHPVKIWGPYHAYNFFMAHDVIFAISAQKVLTSSINREMGQSVLIFRMRPNNTFPTSGQPLS